MHITKAMRLILDKIKDSEQSIEEIIYESCQRFKWWLDGDGKHGITWKLFLKISTEEIVCFYNIDLKYFRKNG